MALVPGPVQKFTNVNIGTTATSVGFVKNCFGARYLLVRVFNAVSANLITLTAASSYDGSTADQNGPNLTNLPTGGVAGDAAGSLVMVGSSSSVFGTTIGVPNIQLLAAQATAGGLITFWVWPVFDTYHPGLPRGQNVLPT